VANPEIVIPPGDPPITAAEVRDQFKYTESAEDGLLTLFITAAVGYLEPWLRRSFIQRSYRLRLDSFRPEHAIIPALDSWGREILLPGPPLIAVSAILYDDTAGVEQTFAPASYQVDAYNEPGRIKPTPGESWPSTYAGGYNAVRIEYTAGYAAVADVPEVYKQMLRWITAIWFRNREGVAPTNLTDVPHTVAAFVESFKMYRAE
jgi:uncharacterized phiE125 gp8 family phage protein